MNERRLIEAFNGSIDRLAAGQTVEDCMRAYPDVGDELRPLLDMGQAASRARASSAEVRNVRARLDSRINTLIEESDFKSPRFHLPPGGAVLLVAILLLVLVSVLLFLRREELETADPTTPTQSTELPSTPLPAATTSATTPTDTPSPTRTRTATPTLTPSASPSSTTEEAVCVVEPPQNWVTYRVQSGDTLAGIATLSGSTVAELQRVNCINDVSSIVIGQLLYVPRLWQSEVDNSTDSPDGNGGQDTGDDTTGNTDDGSIGDGANGD